MWLVRSVCVVIGLCLSTSVGLAAPLKVGDKAPVFTLKALNPDVIGTKYVSLGKMVGAKARPARKGVLLSFFATYCEPCKKELPYLAKLYDLFNQEGFSIVLVSIDEDKEKVEEAGVLAAKSGARFPVVSDRFNIVAKRYQISELPTMFLVDGLGQIVMAKSGYSEDISGELLSGIRQALGKPTAAPVPDSLQPYFPKKAGGGSGGPGEAAPSSVQ